MSKLWSVFLKTDYVLSLAYTASVVLIETDELPPADALPVLKPLITAVPFSIQPSFRAWRAMVAWIIGRTRPIATGVATARTSRPSGRRNVVPDHLKNWRTAIATNTPSTKTKAGDSRMP